MYLSLFIGSNGARLRTLSSPRRWGYIFLVKKTTIPYNFCLFDLLVVNNAYKANFIITQSLKRNYHFVCCVRT